MKMADDENGGRSEGFWLVRMGCLARGKSDEKPGGSGLCERRVRHFCVRHFCAGGQASSLVTDSLPRI